MTKKFLIAKFDCVSHLGKHGINVHKIKMRLDKDFGSILLALTKLIGLRHLIQPDKLYVGTFNPKSEDNGIT